MPRREAPRFVPGMIVPRPRLLLAETDGFTPEVMASLPEWADVRLGPVPRGEIGRALRDFEIVWIRLGHRVRAGDISPNGRCRILTVPATGLDHIDLEACAQAGIRVVSLKGEIDFLRTVTATAEHTIALALALIRKVPAAHASVLEGRWDRDAFRGRELHGRPAGIIGLGRLGNIVAGYLRAFGMKVYAFDPRRDFAETVAIRCATLEELFAASDLVTVHVVYDSRTHHMIKAQHLACARPGAVLINTSRGGIVDQAALLSALENGTLGGAALDVIEGEPNVGRDHPLVAYARKHENLVLTPHVGGNTRDSLAKSEAFIAAKTRRTWNEVVHA